MESRALSDIDGTPTSGMVSEAIRGLEWREEFGRGGTQVGVSRARDIKNKKNLSISSIKRMFSFFSRHEVDKKAEGFRPGENGYPSNGRIAWALWGGDAGFSWSKNKMEQIRKEEERELTKDDNTTPLIIKIEKEDKSIMENLDKRHIQNVVETDDTYIITYEKPKEAQEPMEDSEKVEMEKQGYEEKNDVRSSVNEKEVRHFTLSDIEIREEGENKVVVGYGSVFNSLSNNLGGFREIISPRAFEGRLEDDVRFLFNHDANLVLARTTNNTLRLRVDEKGLRYEAVMPNTSTARDLMELMNNGTINQSSFAFVVEDDEWEQTSDGTVRTINKVSRLYDVSAVTYPAYEDATVALRSMETWKKDFLASQVEKEKEENKREEMDLHRRSLASLKLKLNKLKN